MRKKKTKNKKVKIFDLHENIFAGLGRGIKLGFINLWRNRLLSAATILVIAIMICIFNSILAINHITRQALANLNQKVDIIFYLKDGTDFYSANILASKLREIPGVTKVEYLSKEKALDIISKTYPETADFLIKFNLRNPLPASLSITTEAAENHKAVYAFISETPLNRYLSLEQEENQTDNQKILSSTTQNLININNFVKQIVFWVVFIFIIGGALIIINAIQLTIFTRRKEIFIMKLVGATPNFIRLPFLTEAISYAILSVSLSFVLLFLASYTLQLENFNIIKEISYVNIWNLFILELLICSILALISSLATVKNYSKRHLKFN